jgi:hypothetical protein
MSINIKLHIRKKNSMHQSFQIGKNSSISLNCSYIDLMDIQSRLSSPFIFSHQVYNNCRLQLQLQPLHVKTCIGNNN